MGGEDTERRLWQRISCGDINEPLGADIEDFCDDFVVAPEMVPAFERILLSTLIDNRSAALWALVYYAHRVGYEADAVQLYFSARDADVEQAAAAALDYLGQMGKRGSAAAKRMSLLLARDPWARDFLA